MSDLAFDQDCRVPTRDHVRGRLVLGSAWCVAAAVVPRLLTVPASMICARVLGKSEFGGLGIIQNTVGTLGVFAGLGLGITATRYVAEYHQKDRWKASRIAGLTTIVALLWSGVMAALLLAFAPLLAARVMSAPHLATALSISAALLVFNGVNGTQTGALAGLEAFRTMALVSVCSALCLALLLVGGTRLWGLNGAVLGLVASAAVDCLLNTLALRRECFKRAIPYRLSGCWVEWPVIWKFSVPSFLCGTISGPVTWMCLAMLVNQPNGYAEMGIWSAANQWRTAVLFIPSAIGQVVVPMLAQQFGLRNRPAANRILRDAVLGNAAVVIPIVLVLGLFSSKIMQQYGRDFADGWPVLIAVLATAALLAIQTPVGHILTASGRMWTGFMMNSGWALVFLVSTRLLLKYGALGLSLAMLIAYVVHGVWTFAFCLWLLRNDATKNRDDTIRCPPAN